MSDDEEPIDFARRSQRIYAPTVQKQGYRHEVLAADENINLLRRREIIIDLYARGHLSIRQLQEKVNKTLEAEGLPAVSHETISKDLQEIRQEWRDRISAGAETLRLQHLETLRKALGVAWDVVDSAQNLDTLLKALGRIQSLVESEAKIDGTMAAVERESGRVVTQAEQAAFQDAVLTIIGSVDGEVRDRILNELRQRAPVRRLTGANKPDIIDA